jgi:PTH1 family peptidyl-tRNA hydrolase
VDAPAWIVVGLGNPGPEYDATRHNVGFRVLDAVGAACGGVRWRSTRESQAAHAELAGVPALLVKPLTFMNRSGEAVRALLERARVGPDRLLVVLDDLNLPLGRLRLRPRGSAGGHLGLESVLESCGTREVARLRLGIGEEGMPEDRSRYVLAPFPRERGAEVEAMVERAREAVEAVAAVGVARAMSKYNA